MAAAKRTRKAAAKPVPAKPAAKPAPAKPARAKVAAKAASKLRPAAPAGKAASIDEYLVGVSAESRALLEPLRGSIRRLAPDAEECISYGMPAFRWRGQIVGGFAATSKGGSYYPFSGSTLATLAGELEGFSKTKSAVHFTAASPLPAALVKKLLGARKAEIETAR
jgi:uncharacterized protein YdhG (YjbR/CyaY superfamily)